MDLPHSYERLSPQLEICVSEEHKFGTDAFLLSYFAQPRRKDLALDLCTGCGIVALLWYRDPDEAPAHSYCLDIQEKAFLQMQDTVSRHPFLQDRVTPLLGDLKDPELWKQEGLPPLGGYDLITCNPPYKVSGGGILSETASDRLARHETACTLQDLAAAGKKLLRYGGRLCLCQRPERLPDAMEALRRNQLEPKRLRFVQQHPDTPPWLFLLEGKRGAKPFLQVEPPLIMEGEGGLSREVLNIYHKEHNLPKVRSRAASRSSERR